MKTQTYNKNSDKDWENLKEQLQNIKSVIEPGYLLHSLGFKETFESAKEFRSACVIHGGDNRTAFRFNKKTNTWSCFTHKCQERFGNDVVGLVRAVTGKDFMGAVEYLKQFCSGMENVDFIAERRKKEIQSFIDTYGDVDLKPKEVNEGSLLDFIALRNDYFIKQGYTEDTLSHFEVGHGWVDKYGVVRSVIPIRDDKGGLVAYSLRDERSNVDESNKYILTPGFNKQDCLYNMDKAKVYGEELPLIVVEGFKSVWKLHEYGIKNVVAVMGSGVTEGQQFLLCLYALKGAVILLDNDEAGVSGTSIACKDLSSKLSVSPVFIQEVDENGKGLDPSDLTKEQIYEYLDTYY